MPAVFKWQFRCDLSGALGEFNSEWYHELVHGPSIILSLYVLLLRVLAFPFLLTVHLFAKEMVLVLLPEG